MRPDIILGSFFLVNLVSGYLLTCALRFFQKNIEQCVPQVQHFSHKKKFFQDTLIIFIVIVFGAVLFWRYGFTFSLSAALLFSWIGLLLLILDYQYQWLPDPLCYLLLWAGLLVNLKAEFIPLDEAVIGAVLGYLSLWLIYWIFKIFTRKEGFGYGDFKLIAALSAWLGWKSLPSLIFYSSIVTFVFFIMAHIFLKRDFKKPVPFGPGLIFVSLFLLGSVDISQSTDPNFL